MLALWAFCFVSRFHFVVILLTHRLPGKPSSFSSDLFMACGSTLESFQSIKLVHKVMNSDAEHLSLRLFSQLYFTKVSDIKPSTASVIGFGAMNDTIQVLRPKNTAYLTTHDHLLTTCS